MKNRIELLAPAGNLECLKVAVEAGADAIYLGGNKFGARAFANNFSEENLIEGISYAHTRGIKLYVTLNTLLHDDELQEMLTYVNFLYSAGVDALIIQDIGVLTLVKKYFPDFPIHASTQMAIHNIDGVKQMESLGIKKVVLARELSFKEITQIAQATTIELEIFVHGALCVAYSGQCLMSSMIGGRSGNRGKCAQPCRKKYSLKNLNTGVMIRQLEDKHLLSTRDLNTIDQIDQIIATGVHSLKIEGRMKKAEYVATVVHHYREKIDAYYKNQKVSMEEANYELTSIFNREFTSGYIGEKRNADIVSIERPDNRGIYIGKISSKFGNMIQIKVENNFVCDGDGLEIFEDSEHSQGFTVSGMKLKEQSISMATEGQSFATYCRQNIKIGTAVYKSIDKNLYSKALKTYSYANKKRIDIHMKALFQLDAYPLVELRCDDEIITLYGENKVTAAINKPKSRETIVQQFLKTGDTPYNMKEMDIQIEEHCFISLSHINQLRRQALQSLEEKRMDQRTLQELSFCPTKIMKTQNPQIKEINAGVFSLENAQAAIAAGADAIYVLDSSAAKEILVDCQNHNIPCYFVLPNIMFHSEIQFFEDFLKKYNFYGVVISNIGQLQLIERAGIKNVRGNVTLNIFNSLACDYYTHKLNTLALSPELNHKDIKEITSLTNAKVELLAYGYLPVMTTEYCPISLASKDSSNCNQACKNSSYALVDSRNETFRIVPMGNCRNQILNSHVLFLGEKINKIKELPIHSLRLDFYVENKNQVYDIIQLYKGTCCMGDITKTIEEITSLGFTNGHFFRGVE